MSSLQANTRGTHWQPHVYWHSRVRIVNRLWMQFPTIEGPYVHWGIEWKCLVIIYFRILRKTFPFLLTRTLPASARVIYWAIVTARIKTMMRLSHVIMSQPHFLDSIHVWSCYFVPFSLTQPCVPELCLYIFHAVILQHWGSSLLLPSRLTQELLRLRARGAPPTTTTATPTITTAAAHT